MKKINLNNEVLIIDLDNTLFCETLLTKIFFSISKFFLMLGFNCEKLNKSILNKYKINSKFKKIFVLSGRNKTWGKEITKKQLKNNNIKYNKIILCPRTKIILDWKNSEIKKISKKYSKYLWLDDDNK